LLVIFLIQGSLGKSNTFLFSIIGIASLGAIYSIVAFFRYYFYIEGDKLIVKKGVFKRSILEIPFDRIQSINFEQNLIHRIFSVVKLNMDTAGSAADELQLNALDKGMATALSQKILKNRKKITLAKIEGEIIPKKDEKKTIFQLSLWQLIKVGVTENHLRSGGIIIFFFVWIYDNLREVGLDYKDKLESYFPALEELSQSFVIVIGFIVLFVLSSFLISLFRTVLRFYDLRMSRVGEGFSIQNGLLNKKEQAAKDSKIQLLSWSQNFLQSMVNIYELNMRQAASAERRQSKSFKVVGLSKKDIDNTTAYIFKDLLDELETTPKHGVDFYYLFKRIYYWTLFSIPLFILFSFIERFDFMIYLSVFYLFGLLRSFLSYKKKKFSIGPELMVVNGGVFGRKSTMMMNLKVQNTKLLSTPFQRRRKLRSMAIFTASGVLMIPDIKMKLAKQIQDFLIYKVEKSGGDWM